VTTPSQTVGPFLSIGLRDAPEAVPAGTPGRIRLHGLVLDGAGAPVPDALVETWQEAGFARCGTDDDGRWAIFTVRAPYIDVSVFARGLLNRVITRVHFAEEDVDAAVPAARRHTLVATPDGDGRRFDIRLQGEDETVFFEL